jgi:undecaprenyl-diphosphatase
VGLVEAIVLGLVQGLTEFLPVSSTAHIRIVPALFGWPDPGAPFTAAIQLGTLVAVIAYFWKDLGRALSGWLRSFSDPSLRNTPESRLGWAVFIGSIPIIVLGVAFKDRIETGLRSLWVIAISLIAVGVLMAIAELVASKRRSENEVQPSDGLIVGLFQALALIPGVSRSGSTISGALFLGFERAEAARFSFLLSIPSVFAAGVYSLWKHKDLLMGSERMAVWVANGVSLISGYLAIAFLIRLLQKHGIYGFVVYRIVVGVAILIALFQGALSAT